MSGEEGYGHDHNNSRSRFVRINQMTHHHRKLSGTGSDQHSPIQSHRDNLLTTFGSPLQGPSVVHTHRALYSLRARSSSIGRNSSSSTISTVYVVHTVCTYLHARYLEAFIMRYPIVAAGSADNASLAYSAQHSSTYVCIQYIP